MVGTRKAVTSGRLARRFARLGQFLRRQARRHARLLIRREAWPKRPERDDALRRWLQPAPR
jgi:hypothetical protein